MIDKATGTDCNYKQETLLKCLQVVDDEAHNALSDKFKKTLRGEVGKTV